MTGTSAKDSAKQQSTSSLGSVAYLGPKGSYTELALTRQYDVDSAVPCLSISEVFAKLAAGEVDHAFVPLENIAQGPVAQTLDCLFEHKGKIAIVSSTLTHISHCLGVLEASEIDSESLSKISEVHSHEQALRQCSQYLRTNTSQAELCSARSTGAAAERIAEEKLLTAAVVAAESTLERLGFRILARNIADIANNRTRFVVLARGVVGAAAATMRPKHPMANTEQFFVTSIALDPGRDRKGILHEVLTIISMEHQVNLLSIHSRPDAKGGFVFHLDLEGAVDDPSISRCLEKLDYYCAEVTGSTASLEKFGSYPQERFHALPFRKIGILGGNGIMGRWFSQFFGSAGLEVEICDVDTEQQAADLAKSCDVLLLSVPMSQMADAIDDLVPHLRPGTLLVENASIKGCALPKLLDASPAEVEVLGIHTMFGGDIQQLQNQNIIITTTDSSGEKAQAFEDLLYKFGAKLTHVDIVAHDRITAYLQALFQLTLVALAEVLRKSVDSSDEIDPFSTPNSRNLLTSMERVLQQSDSLLVDLQTLNDEYPQMRHVFLQCVFNLVFSLDRGTSDEFLESAKLSREFFTKVEAEQ